MTTGWLTQARREFHATLLGGILTRNATGAPSNADKDSKVSVALANSILDQLGVALTAEKLPGQTAGSDFEEISMTFVRICFERMRHLRPGNFLIEKGGAIARFDQYSHLADLDKLAKANPTIATALGSDYLIKPDIVIARWPESDATINEHEPIVDASTGLLSSIRQANQNQPILHASISCKWTLRSDRAQNARSEGLNLVRNRKGRLPHICVITGEPMPSRIASLALGTGDIDCVYHFALPELRNALVAMEAEDRLETFETMVAGKRLRDIADLPLDLVC